MLEKSEILAVVLAGGAGRRFNGQDKGLVLWQSKPLVQHAIDAIAPQVGEVLISANRHIDRYKEFAQTVLVDKGLRFSRAVAEPKHAAFEGPLAGIDTAIKFALQSHSYKALLVCTCDSPSLPEDYVQRLRTQLESNDVAVVHDGERRQNLHCLVTRNAWASLSDFFDDGGRAMHRWFSKIEVIEVDFTDEAQRFRNINTPEEVERKQKR